MKSNTAGWMEFSKICLKYCGERGGVEFKKQLLNITALMTRLDRSFPCLYVVYVECRNESYSEPHCTISETLAAKVVKQLEKRSYVFVFIFLMS